MSDTLIIILAVATAIGAAMGFVAWRINRLQYPPQHRWPDERKRGRKQDRRAPRKHES